MGEEERDFPLPEREDFIERADYEREFGLNGVDALEVDLVGGNLVLIGTDSLKARIRARATWHGESKSQSRRHSTAMGLDF